MKVLLVYPNVRGMNMLPPAVALFSALLKARGHVVSLFDATDYPNHEDMLFDSDKSKEKNLNARPFDDTLLRKSFKEEDVFSAFERHVESFGPELLAVSVTEDMFPLGIQLLRRVAHRKVPSIMGGVFATFAPQLVMTYPEVDMCCVGEGEDVLTQLCDRLEARKPYDDIAGLWSRRKDGSVKANPMALPVDIDSNPILDISIFAEGRLYRPMQGKVWKMFPLETHRGCPYTCTYCNSPFQSEKYKVETGASFFRKKKPQKIREEILHFRDQYQVEGFYFWADTFFAYSEKEFDEFIEMYSEFKIPFWCQTRPETITEKRVKQLADIGMFRMGFGIEHGNHEYRMKYLKRNVSNDVIVKAMNIVNGLGIPFSVNNILGLPYETRELTFDTIELNRRFDADSNNAYSFSPFHGTSLRVMAEEAGFIEKGLIARSLTKPTTLKMEQYPSEQIEGMRRCFVLYLKLPKSRWPEIEKAEKLTPEGDRLWGQLRDEVAALAPVRRPGVDNGFDAIERMALGS